MIRFLRRLLGKEKTKPIAPQVMAGNSEPEDLMTKTKRLATVDMDGITPENRPAIYEELVKLSSFSLFEGEVEHGYSKAAVESTASCPRCHEPTRQHCAHFVYATDIAARVMLAPAGYFCTQCPTVIVDEEMIAKGMKAGLKFQGVVGIDYGGKRDPSLFRTWNGQKAVLLIDENEQLMGLSTLDSKDIWRESPPPQSFHRQNRKLKRTLAKRARQRNRRG